MLVENVVAVCSGYASIVPGFPDEMRPVHSIGWPPVHRVVSFAVSSDSPVPERLREIFTQFLHLETSNNEHNINMHNNDNTYNYN